VMLLGKCCMHDLYESEIAHIHTSCLRNVKLQSYGYMTHRMNVDIWRPPVILYSRPFP
jgi:hypothetical protein